MIIFLFKLNFVLFFLIAFGMLFIPERMVLSNLYRLGLLGLKITSTLIALSLLSCFLFCS